MRKPKEIRKLGTAKNRKAAAARMNLPDEMLTEAANAGCDAFQTRGSVDMDRLSEWIASNPDFVKKWSDKGGIPPRAVSQAIVAHFDGLERKRRYEEKIGKLIPRSACGQDMRTLAGRQKSILEKNEGKILTPEVIAEICLLNQAAIDGLFQRQEAK